MLIRLGNNRIDRIYKGIELFHEVVENSGGIWEGDIPDSRIIGAIGVQNGKFKYWFKDKNIKPTGIENVINLKDNGAYSSSCGKFQGKVNYDNLYIGAGYGNLFESIKNYSYGGFSTTVEKLKYNDYNVEITGAVNNASKVYLVENLKLNTDNFIKFKIDNFPVGAKVGIGDNGNINNDIQKDEDGYYYYKFNISRVLYIMYFEGVNVGDKIRVYDIQCYEQSAENLVNDVVPNGDLSIPVTWELDTHSVIMKNGKYGSAVRGEGKYPIAFNSYSCYFSSVEEELIGAETNVLLSDSTKILKYKTDSGYDTRQMYTSSYLASPNCINFKIHDMAHLRYDKFGITLFYEGNLTQEEMETELAKNIIIPDIGYEYNVPNYLGENNVNFKPVQDGLICWLDGRDGSGTDAIWIDRSGNGNDAEIYAFTWGDNYLSLEGYATLTNTTKNLNEYTLEFNFETTNTLTWNAIFTNRSLGVNGYSLNLNGQNVVTFYNSTEYKNINLGFTGILLERVCFTVVCVSDGSNTKFTFYKNGVKGSESTLPLAISDSNIMALNTRSQNNGAPVFPKDNRKNKWYSFKAYNRALTDAEIMWNYEYEQSIRGEN